MRPPTRWSGICTKQAQSALINAAVVTKDDKDKVHVSKDEMATRTVVGAAPLGEVVGILFPPSIAGSTASGSWPSAATSPRSMARSAKELAIIEARTNWRSTTTNT